MHPSELEVLRLVAERLASSESADAVESALQAVSDAWPTVHAALVAGEPSSPHSPPSGVVVQHWPLRGGPGFSGLRLTFDEGESPSEEWGRSLAAWLELELQRRSARVHGRSREGLVGNSSELVEALRLVERLALTAETVLLVGEAGSGKEVLARYLHAHSAFAPGPFIVFNGAALPEAMVDAELFGHPRGRGGRFEEAQNGTLVVKDVGLLPEGARRRLFVERTGAPFRLVLTSRAPLETLIENQHLPPRVLEARQVVEVPPLRERGSDIVLLADHFVLQTSLQTGKDVKRISTPALEMLLTYPWPGNVRELASVVEKAVLATDDEVIHGYHLPPSLQSSVYSGTTMHGRLEDRLASLEYEMLVEALKSTRGNVTLAARELGLTKRVMGLRLKKYELDYRPFRQGPDEWSDDDDVY